MTQKNSVNILVVDDDAKNLTAIESILKDIDATLIKVDSGEKALRKCLENKFALILLDVKMPGMNGYETAELIHNKEGFREIPIIFLTAYDRSDEGMKRAYSLGAVDFIFKPIIPDMLKSKVNVFVQLHRKNEESLQQAEETARERERAEKLAADIERLKRERLSLEEMVSSSKSTTASVYGLKPMREGTPDIFKRMVQQYALLLETALKEQIYKVEYDTRMKLHELAHELGLVKAGPRDIVDIHLESIDRMTKGFSQSRKGAYEEEGRFLLIELMGYLVSAYRTKAFGSQNTDLSEDPEDKDI